MKNKSLFIFAFFAWLFPAAMLLFPILTGNIPFWYDPARDMLSAWDNLHKLTLIGPTSGIPGIFYGPYWIWFLSVPIFFSKDPRLTTFVVSFLPYFLVLPFILWQFRSVFSKFILVLLWLTFIFTYQSYALFLWNPNNAPILFLLAIYLFISLDFTKKTSWQLRHVFLAGLAVGLALNIDISFGTVFFLGSLLYLVFSAIFFLRKEVLKKVKQFALLAVSFMLGIGVMFAPFFLFELRHGFEQTKTALHALSRGGDVVTVHGMTKPEIAQNFFMIFATLLHSQFVIAMVILSLTLVVILIGTLKKKISFTHLESRLLLILLSIALSCLGLYLSVRNPVWGYHFIGVEMLWLLFLGVILTKIPYIKYIFPVWILIIVISSIQGFLPTLRTSPLLSQSLVTKEYIVRTIIHDAGKNQYSVYAYSPSIYIYEYSYLFRWLANKNIPYDPGMEQKVGDVYLILPQADQSKLNDFITYRTPNALYKTTGDWHIPDGTIILRRELIK